MIRSPPSRIPNEFSKFMKYGQSKTCLIDLICEVISMNYKKALKMLKWKEIYLSKEDGCFLCNENGFHSATLFSQTKKTLTVDILQCLDALKK